MERMSRWMNLVIFYSKRLITSKFYVGALLVYTVMLSVRYIVLYNGTSTDYGNVLGELFVPGQMLFMIYMVFFIAYLLKSVLLAWNVISQMPTVYYGRKS